MKKLLLPLVIVFIALSVQAQSMDELKQKIEVSAQVEGEAEETTEVDNNELILGTIQELQNDIKGLADRLDMLELKDRLNNDNVKKSIPKLIISKKK